MTLREKLELEHPECINENFHGGCKDCPSMYGYCDKNDEMCDVKTCTDELCRRCWNRNYEGELTPQEKRIEQLEKNDRFNRNVIEILKAERTGLSDTLSIIVDNVEDTTGSFKGAFKDSVSFVKEEFNKLLSQRNKWRLTCFILAGAIVGNIIATFFIR